MTDKKEQVIVCPNCGNKTPQVIRCTAISKDEAEFPDMPEEPPMEVEVYHLFVQCKACQEVSIYWDWENNPELGDLRTTTLVYPTVKKLSGIPRAIEDSYQEAKKVQKISPIAFSVLIRKALEYLCKDQNAIGSNLKEQLDNLARRNIIPTTLAKMADVLRYLGNISAHSIEVKISKEEAEILDDFFTAVVEYVYIAPEKLNKLIKKLKIL